MFNESIIVKDRVHVAQKLSVLLAPDSIEVNTNTDINTVTISDDIIVGISDILINMSFLKENRYNIRESKMIADNEKKRGHFF